LVAYKLIVPLDVLIEWDDNCGSNKPANYNNKFYFGNSETGKISYLFMYKN